MQTNRAVQIQNDTDEPFGITITEPHAGEFSGHHARYVLRSKVTPGRCAAGEEAA